MDLHNNAIGHEIGSANPIATAEEIVQLVEEQRKAGKLVVFKNPLDKSDNSPLVPSNNQKIKVYLKDAGGNVIKRPPTNLGIDNVRVIKLPIIIPEVIKN